MHRNFSFKNFETDLRLTITITSKVFKTSNSFTLYALWSIQIFENFSSKNSRIQDQFLFSVPQKIHQTCKIFLKIYAQILHLLLQLPTDKMTDENRSWTSTSMSPSHQTLKNTARKNPLYTQFPMNIFFVSSTDWSLAKENVLSTNSLV